MVLVDTASTERGVAMATTQRISAGTVPIQHFPKRARNSISWMLLYERNVGVFQSKIISVSYSPFRIETPIRTGIYLASYC